VFSNHLSILSLRKSSSIKRYLIRLKPNYSNIKKYYFFYIFLLISEIHYMYKFIILGIRTKKKIVLIFLKCRSSSYGFHKLVIKFKNACRDINKTIFLDFLYLMMLNHAMYFFYLCKYDILFIFERLGYKQFKIKLYF